MARSDRIARIEERLTKIALQDSAAVMGTNEAMNRAARLGITADVLRAWLTSEPPADDELKHPKPFHGFDSRHQAMLALDGSTRRVDRPGARQDHADRIGILLKNREPPRAATTIGLAIISIPAMQALPPAEQDVKRFKRLKNGRLREITSIAEADTIEMEAGDELESTFVMKKPVTP